MLLITFMMMVLGRLGKKIIFVVCKTTYLN